MPGKKLGKLFGKKKKTSGVVAVSAITATVLPSAEQSKAESRAEAAGSRADVETSEWVAEEPVALPTVSFTAVDPVAGEVPKEEKHIGDVMDEEETKKQFWSVRKQAVKKAKKKKKEPEAAAPAPAPAPAATSSSEYFRMRRLRASQASSSRTASKSALDVSSDMQFPTLGGKTEAPKAEKSSNVWASLTVDTDTESEDEVEPEEPEEPLFGVFLADIPDVPGTPPSKEELRSEVDSMINEYRSTHDTAELQSRIAAIAGPAEARSTFVARLLEVSLDWSDGDMDLVDKAFTFLVGNGTVARESIVEGASLVLEEFNSLALDVPLVGTYMAKMLSTVVTKKVLPPQLLPDKLAKAMGVDNKPVEEPTPTASSAPVAASAPAATAAASGESAAAASSSSEPTPSSSSASATATDTPSASDPAKASLDLPDDAPLEFGKKDKKKKKKKKGFALDS